MSGVQQQPNQGMGALFLMLAVIFGVMAMVLWGMKHEQITLFMLKMSRLLLMPFLMLPSATEKFHAIGALMGKAKVLEFGDLMATTRAVALYYTPPILAGMAWVAWRATQDPLRNFRNTHDAESLMRCMSINFPFIIPVMGQGGDLLKDKIKGREHGLRPHEFAAKHKLVVKRQFDEDKARAVFSAQIGEPFNLSRLKPHQKALYAVFATQLAGDRDGAIDLLMAMARSCTPENKYKPNYSLANQMFSRHKDQGKPFYMVHGYTSTVLMSMLLAAKPTGRLAPSFFIWLKPVDRNLWYALHRVGAQTPWPEAAGTWNHWQAEQVAWTGKDLIAWDSFRAPEDVWVVSDEDHGKCRWQLQKRAFILEGIRVEEAISGLAAELADSGLIQKRSSKA